MIAALATVAVTLPSLAVTLITVDTTDDPDNLLSRSCTYNGNTVFAAADGLCTFRRAIREASARPQADRPIVIRFNIPTTDPGYNAALQTWTLTLDDQLPVLETLNDLNNNGQVWIKGDSQPGGRVTGPPILIDDGGTLGGYSLQIESENNLITDLGFQGGTNISLLSLTGRAAHNTTIDSVWIGLDDDGTGLSFQTPADPVKLAVATGIVVRSDNNTITNSVITGAFGRAINIDSGTTNTTIDNVLIGTRADGTVPFVDPAIECAATLSPDPADWLGGWGIALSGTGHHVTNSTIAGLQNLRSANDTPPVAIEVFGADHLIDFNVIGVDAADAQVGVCGAGIKLAGSGSDVLGNIIVRSRSGFLTPGGNPLDTAILYNEDDLGDYGEITVRANVVIAGPGDVYAFGPVVPDSLKLFEPALVTSLNGLQVSGTSAPGSSCPNCTIDFYRDDSDAVQEALEYLGFATADGAGSFTFQLPAPPAPGQALRTSSTTNGSGVIAGFGPGTTSKLSGLQGATCHALTLSRTGSGSNPVASPTATPGCAAGEYQQGEPITLTAAPAAGWAVSAWTGSDDDSSTSAVNALTMPGSAATVTVAYAIVPCYALTRGHSGAGANPVATPASSAGCATGQYHQGESIILTASPSLGWVVQGWTGTDADASSSVSNSVIMPASPRTVTTVYVQALFADGFESGDLSLWSSSTP